jgi:hypothetical protein
MSKLTLTLSISLFSLMIISCSKEESQEQKGLSGNYKFISAEAHIVSTTEAGSGPDNEKVITYTDYITKNNSGSLLFSGGNISSQNFSFSVDTTIKTFFYSNNVLLDSRELPFQVTMPPSNSTSTYKMITSDSIYVNGGFGSIGNGPQQQTMPSGGKIKFEGNMLYMTFKGIQSSSQIEQGQTILMNATMNVKYTFQKM